MHFEVENLCKHYGGIKVLKNLTMEIKESEIVGIMGPNGAGKTTLINLISGLENVDSGDIFLNGERITNLAPHVIAQKGIRRSFQTTSNFEDETVAENVRAALITNNKLSRNQENDAIRNILADVELLGLAHKKVRDIPIAYSKLIELCRCMVSGPKLVLLDELYAGLTWEESKMVTKLIKDKKNTDGTSFILIEHRTEILFDAVDRIMVLNLGSNFFEGLPCEVAANELVSKLYWGK